MNSPNDSLFPKDDALDVKSADPFMVSFIRFMSEHALIEDYAKAHDYLESVMPATSADNVNASREIAVALRQAKELSQMALNTNEKIAAKASAMRTLQAAIGALVRYQTPAYNIERLKLLERAIMITLHGHADAQSLLNKFNDVYKKEELKLESQNSTA